jgi:hypothetical protein
MAGSPKPQGKRELINKANTTMVVSVAVAGFMVVFSLIASRALFSQRSYQGRVIDGKQQALKQLEENEEAVKQLKVTYGVFVGNNDNVIGGSSQGYGDKDGNNAKIILDALPSKYDFPATVTGVEKLLISNDITVKSLSGKDDELNQVNQQNKGPVEMPFQISAETKGFKGVKKILDVLHRSIRPIKANKISISGGDETTVNLSLDVVTYYQPAQGFEVKKEVVK